MRFLSELPLYLRVLIAVCLLALSTRCAIHLVSPNYNLAAEANGLYGILELADANPLYPPHTHRPHQIYLYGPVHGMLFGLGLRVLNIKSLSQRVFTIRVWSFLLFCATLILWWKNALKPMGIGLGPFLLSCLLGLTKFADYVTTARNETLSLFFQVLSIVFYLKWVHQENKKWLLMFILVCTLSFYTRQTGLTVFISAIACMVWRRKHLVAVISLFCFGTTTLLLFFTINNLTLGAFVEQSILANIRGWRPLNRTFLDYSFLTFCGSQILFSGLTLYGLISKVKDPYYTQGFLRLVTVISFITGLSFLRRAGGDVNYFFESMLVGTLFCSQAIKTATNNIQARSIGYGLVGIQLLFSSATYSYKSLLAYRTAVIPFKSVARNIQDRFQPYIFIWGSYAPNLIIHLRPISYHGPDVTTTSFVARNAHPALRWIFDDLNQFLKENKLNTLVVANPECDKHYHPWIETPLGNYFGHFKRTDVWYPWLCLYQDSS